MRKHKSFFTFLRAAFGAVFCLLAVVDVLIGGTLLVRSLTDGQARVIETVAHAYSAYSPEEIPIALANFSIAISVLLLCTAVSGIAYWILYDVNGNAGDQRESVHGPTVLSH